ncbi:hypothetical protein [Caulobacter segnis]
MMKPIGRDGQPIPLPPDVRSGREIAGGYTRFGLWLLAWPLGMAGALLVLLQPPFNRFGWTPIAQNILLVGIVICIVVAVFTVGGGLLAWLSSPFRSREAGRRFERRVRRLTPEQIVEEIAEARAVLGALSDPGKRRGWERWLAWLERQANVPPAERTALAEGTYPAKRSAVIGNGVFFAVLLVGGVWLAWENQDWWLWGLFGLIIVICGIGAATHIGERLVLTADRLTYYGFGRLQWSVPREHVATKESGEATFEIHDLSTGRMLGSIDGETFGAEIVEALADLFPPLAQREEA